LEEINHRKSLYLEEALENFAVHRIYGIDITTTTTIISDVYNEMRHVRFIFVGREIQKWFWLGDLKEKTNGEIILNWILKPKVTRL
jgi:hypothetical protein